MDPVIVKGKYTLCLLQEKKINFRYEERINNSLDLPYYVFHYASLLNSTETVWGSATGPKWKRKKVVEPKCLASEMF